MLLRATLIIDRASSAAQCGKHVSIRQELEIKGKKSSCLLNNLFNRKVMAFRSIGKVISSPDTRDIIMLLLNVLLQIGSGFLLSE
jgi:hypothetical protein